MAYLFGCINVICCESMAADNSAIAKAVAHEATAGELSASSAGGCVTSLICTYPPSLRTLYTSHVCAVKPRDLCRCRRLGHRCEVGTPKGIKIMTNKGVDPSCVDSKVGPLTKPQASLVSCLEPSCAAPWMKLRCDLSCVEIWIAYSHSTHTYG